MVQSLELKIPHAMHFGQKKKKKVIQITIIPNRAI